MLRRTQRGLAILGMCAALTGSLIAFAASADNSVTVAKPAIAAASPKALQVAVTKRSVDGLAGFDPLSHTLQDNKLVAALPNGSTAELTLDPGLQAHMERVFADYSVPYGALVAIEPSTGKVLAYVSHSSANPDAGDLARDPTPPAASVFKVVTASALVDDGVAPTTKVCYGGGLSRLSMADLEDNAKRDRQCATLRDALGGSINSVIAKLADRNLDPKTIRRYADAFGFGQGLPFDVRTTPSPAEVPEERLEFARTAAGFWHMHMSPMHGALIAATFANGGNMPRATMIERVLDAKGKETQHFVPAGFRSVISRATAKTVGKMMLSTVESGTAHSAFFDEHRRPFVPNVAIAGKTGSLSTESPYRAYSWWVGFAPEDKPTIALAALVVNTPKWRIKGSYVAREAMRYYLVERNQHVAAQK
jgi:penicillin-binding protein A